MSCISNLSDDEFKFVPYRKRGKRFKINQAESKNNENIDGDIDKDAVLRRIESAKQEIYESDLFSSTIASLREGLALLGNPEVKEAVCLGLGRIGERLVSRYQLALLLCLRSNFNLTVFVHDPIFCDSEREILTNLGLEVIEENREGKFKARLDSATIFFLPHCPKQLSNNLLWSNWNLNLKNCVVIANSFTEVTEQTPKRNLTENASYIFRIFPYVVELPIINTFKYFEVFNDTAIHIFPPKKLTLIPSDFWEDNSEPIYSLDSVEFITNNFVNVSLEK